MIVRFVTGKQFSPSVRTQVEIFSNKGQMKKGAPIYTGLEPLSLSAQHAAMKVKSEGEREVEILFDGYLPPDWKSLVTKPFTSRRISIINGVRPTEL